MGFRGEILVTGGCGYIGSHVVRQLSVAGWRVHVVDNLSTGHRDSLLHGEDLYVGDCGDIELVEHVLSTNCISTVMHFAASIVVPESVENPLKYYENNTVGMTRLLTACQRSGVNKFVFSSTAAVYGENQTGAALDEATPTNPANPYGWSKLMDEIILRDVAIASDLRYVALRYFNVAGADPEGRIGQRTPNATHLLKAACEVAVGKREELQIFGDDYPTRDGTCIRDFIHVEDLADAHLRAIAYLENGGDRLTANCGYGRGITVREVVSEIEALTGRRLPHRVVGRRRGDVATVVADSARARSLLGWNPAHDSLTAIVKSALDWEMRIASPQSRVPVACVAEPKLKSL